MMIKILIVKLTSMGDVLHLLPALTDLQKQYPDAKVDWIVEDSFSDIPTWHPLVNKVYKASTRRWRKFNRQSRKEYRDFKHQLQQESYDVVVDAQGLIKSAWISRLARLSDDGYRAGFSGSSIKESPAAWNYKKTVDVDRNQHAVLRLKELFAGIFTYSLSPEIDYGIRFLSNKKASSDSIFLFHGTTWSSKHVPNELWRELRDQIIESGNTVKLTWGNEVEKQRAQWIAENKKEVIILPKTSLTNLAQELSSAKGAVAVDTGLGHLSAALSVPTVSLYGSTNAKLTGAMGNYQIHNQSTYSCSPCLLKKCDKLNSQVSEPPCYDELLAKSILMKLAGECDKANFDKAN